jgi:hypothetical protein
MHFCNAKANPRSPITLAGIPAAAADETKDFKCLAGAETAFTYLQYNLAISCLQDDMIAQRY